MTTSLRGWTIKLKQKSGLFLTKSEPGIVPFKQHSWFFKNHHHRVPQMFWNIYLAATVKFYNIL
jgi:hypothetical protein